MRVTRVGMTGGRFLRWRRRRWGVDRSRSSRQLWPLCLRLGNTVHHRSTQHATKSEEVSVPRVNDKAKVKSDAVCAENRPENRKKIAMDLGTTMPESEAMVCAEVHQLCRTEDEGN